MAQLNFDASQVEPDAGIAVVPAGWYNVAIDESDIKPTKDGAGLYLKLRFNILDGQYKGRKVFTQLNIRHPNQQTQEIAQKQLSAIGHSVGVLQIADSQQLHGIPFKMRVKIRPAEGAYDESNEPTAYRNINEQVETVGASAAGAPAGGFAPPPQAQAPAAQGWAPPAPAVAAPPAAAAFAPPAQPQNFAPAPAAETAQPWAAPAAAAFAQPAVDPANPFAAPAAQAQPWAGGAAPAPAADPAVAPATGLPQPDPAALAAAQGAAPPWAAPAA